MKQQHWYFLLAAFILFMLMYLGLDTRTKTSMEIEKTRAESLKATSFAALESEAHDILGAKEKNALESLAYQAENAESENDRIDALKLISGFWFRNANPALAGHYAAQVAELIQSGEAWSICGTTFAAGIGHYDDREMVRYCAENAKTAIENAISLEPENLDYRSNLAAIYAEVPPEKEPMKGIMMLLELNRNNPDHAGTSIQLARFGMQTGQWSKAEQRLLRVLENEPENQRAICMLAKLYEETGDTNEAATYLQRCNND